MTINARGPVIATILGFGGLILVLLGLIIGWRWIAPATEAAEEERTTAAVTAQMNIISELEAVPNIEAWDLSYDKAWDEDGPYDLMVDIGDERVYFYDRKSLSDFIGDIKRVDVFQE
jgi:hypothetical protein